MDIPVPSQEGNVRHSASKPTGGHVHNVPRKRSQALGVQLVVATSYPIQPVAIPEQFAVTVQRVSVEQEHADLIQQRA